MRADGSLADLQGPAGNTYDKYGTRNPVARLLVSRFLTAVEESVRELRPGSLLDVGCGEGVVTERLARAFPATRAVGVDVADPALLEEWEGRRAPNLGFAPGSAYSLPYGDGAFEVVSAFEVLEHLERPDEALAELARVASRALVLSVPREPWWRATNVLSGRYVRALGNTPGHVNHWTREAFRRFAGGAGDVSRIRSPYPWTVVSVEKA
jgi:ubiquinone/menaquinone biosynthesis C-methylase UbiE